MEVSAGGPRDLPRARARPLGHVEGVDVADVGGGRLGRRRAYPFYPDPGDSPSCASRVADPDQLARAPHRRCGGVDERDGRRRSAYLVLDLVRRIHPVERDDRRGRRDDRVGRHLTVVEYRKGGERAGGE